MDGKCVSDLKVAELRVELEKRNLEKIGVKQVLVERLKDALISEGHDPSTYVFNDLGPLSPSLEISLIDIEETSESQTRSEATENSKLEKDTNASTTESLNKDTVDSDPYVVHIEEPEEDLDYDLKGENLINQAENKPECSEGEKDGKIQKDSGSSSTQAKEQSNLRVSNLTKSTKAVDLKQHFSAHGKVISAKILASTRSPMGCFGFLKMASSEDAASCILNLDGTEFNGTVIKVEVIDKEPVSAKSTSKQISASKPIRIFRNARRFQIRRFRGAFNPSSISRKAAPRPMVVKSFNRPTYLTSQLTRSINRASRYLSKAPLQLVPQALQYQRRRFLETQTMLALQRRSIARRYPLVYQSRALPRISYRSKIDSPPPRQRETISKPLRWLPVRPQSYSSSKSIDAIRREQLNEKREVELYRRSSLSKSASRPSSVRPQRTSIMSQPSPFRSPLPSYQKITPDRYGSLLRPERSERESLQFRNESNRYSYPSSAYKVERPHYSNAFSRSSPDADTRRPVEHRFWRNDEPSPPRQYSRYERSRSPNSPPTLRYIPDRRDPSPQWRRSIGSTSEFVPSSRTYGPEVYPRRNGDLNYSRQRSPPDQRQSSKIFSSRVIDYGHRSESVSSPWATQSRSNYYDSTGSQSRQNYQSRQPHY